MTDRESKSVKRKRRHSAIASATTPTIICPEFEIGPRRSQTRHKLPEIRQCQRLWERERERQKELLQQDSVKQLTLHAQVSTHKHMIIQQALRSGASFLIVPVYKFSRVDSTTPLSASEEVPQYHISSRSPPDS